MRLLLLIALPVLGGLAAWIAGRHRPVASRWIALLTLVADTLLALTLLRTRADPTCEWLHEIAWDWMPRFGVEIHLGLDGLSLPLVLLTLVLGIVSVLASWTEITRRVGFFHLNLLCVLAGVLGVFLALDLVLFYVFWELMLVPMFALIVIWGHEQRVSAAIRFFLFTQASGLLMLVSILGLALVHRQASGGDWTFDYATLVQAEQVGQPAGLLLMLGFFAAFAVKLPAVPFHIWLPDAHAQAPTAGSIVLAGLLLKTGAYGLLRLALPLFPAASVALGPIALALGLLSVFYGALQVLGQRDLKRLVAYTSVSHMGFVLLGAYAGQTMALQGVVLLLVCHGLSTGGLFAVAGMISERLGTRDLSHMGGLWGAAPRLSGLTLLLALASLGLLAYARTRPRSVEAGMKYLVLAGASSAFLLLGIAFAYAATGQLAFEGWRAVPTAEGALHGGLLEAGVGLIVVGLGFKLALVPFHMWTPDVYQGAHPPATTFIASVSKAAVAAVLLRLAVSLDAATSALGLVLAGLAVASMLVGNVLALWQRELRRLLAYSSIAHLGYILAALAAAGSLATEAVTFYVAAYTVSILAALGVVGAMASSPGSEELTLDACRGLAWQRPWTAAALGVSLLSLAGIPLTAGFMGKLYVLAAGVSASRWVLVGTLVVGTALGLFYYLRVLIVMLAVGAGSPPAACVSFGTTIALVMLVVLILGIGTVPAPLQNAIRAVSAWAGG